jgi:16S rRNA (adenine1518-N6/adenine1519-N6)-dimethyltransferase
MTFPSVHGIAVKKKHGQHFLRQQSVVDHTIQAVPITECSSIFEIGCGDGFLTRAILKTSCARLWVFEIDPEWLTYIKARISDPRLELFLENFLDVDPTRFQSHKPWILLANLPYQVTFPILHWLQRNRALLQEGVIMVQEEVAQKILKTSGRGYGYPALFFQHYFEWRKLEKVPPSAFLPPPKVMSRLLHLKPRQTVLFISQESKFWEFVKCCFKQPRRTLKNNLLQTHYNLTAIPEETLQLRAQQMDMHALLELWQKLC